MTQRKFQLSFLLLLLSLSLSLAAQPVKDSVTIEVVDVPVFVTRANGSVQGLTHEDFELFVNGKPQAIDYFDLVGNEGSHPDQSSSLRERRLFLVLFDIAFSQPHSLGRAQKAAGELIDKATPDDLFAIATYSTRRGVWFATPFTSDRVALARGISSLSNSSSGDPLSIVLTASERISMRDWAMDRADGIDGFTRASLIDRLSGDELRDVWEMEFRRAIDDQILAFKNLSGRLATLQGQKHVVVLSEGYDTGNPQGRLDVQNARLGNDFAGIRTRTLATSYGGAFRYLKEMNDAFQANDILLHTLDLKGVHPMPGNDALGVLAHGTGGRFVHNRNDLGPALVDLTESVSAGYVLGFKPVNAKRGHNRIEVKVKGLPRGADVRYRRGFSGTPQKVDVNEGLYLADVILNDVPQTGTAPVLSVAGNQLKVSVPLLPLAAQLGMSGKAELLVYLFGANGVALGFQRVTVDVASDATGEKSYAVDLPEGAKVAKALLRVDDSLGFVKAAL